MATATRRKNTGTISKSDLQAVLTSISKRAYSRSVNGAVSAEDAARAERAAILARFRSLLETA